MKFFTACVAFLAAPLVANAAAIEHVNALEARQASTTPPALTNRAWITGTLAYINRYRLAHGAVPYQWNSALATYAQGYANKCVMEHSHGPYSENIYWTSASSLDFFLGTANAVDAWMSEQPLYTDPNNPNLGALHYTALMWKSSKRIGCAWSTSCGSAGTYLFCEMDPQGNVLTQFAANVQN